MSNSQIPVAIVVRVSTAKQETARRISELQQYAASKNYHVVEVCQETISGSAADDDRHGLRRAEQLAHTGKIKKVLAHEISRIARRNSVAHRFVETLEEFGVSLRLRQQKTPASWLTGVFGSNCVYSDLPDRPPEIILA